VAALADLVGYVADLPDRVVLDEVQRVTVWAERWPIERSVGAFQLPLPAPRFANRPTSSLYVIGLS
jgi:hypothetical protein